MTSLLDESFEGAGYENTWVENVGSGSTVDPDSTDVTPPSGGGSQIFKFQKVSPNYNAKARFDIGSEVQVMYFTMWFRFAAEGLSDWNQMHLARGFNASDLQAWSLQIQQQSGATPNICARFQYRSGGSDVSATRSSPFAVDTWVRMDAYYNTSANEWAYRLDESVIDSGSLSATTRDTHYIEIGNDSESYTLTAYIDLVMADDSGYPTVPPTGNPYYAFAQQ